MALYLACFALFQVELQWLEHPWDYENLFETGVVRAIEPLRVDYSARSDGIIGMSFRFSSM